MTKLLSYWPKLEEVDRCIKTEAETASDAVLLSVHQKTPLSKRDANHSSRVSATEDELLDDFLTEHLPEGTKLLAITGDSGAGKSHMIRWLAAHLERDDRAKNMHVIRIPKSANLKAVVELILEPLRHDERFAEARKALEEAVASVNPEDGAIHFAANLEVALREEAKVIFGMLRENPGRADARDLKTKLDHARRLPNYFNDAALSDHFKGKVLPKIVERAIVGKSEKEDEKFPQFAVEDLKLPPEIGLGDAAKDVKLYYQTVLNKGENGEGYKKAAEVLNSVVDKAIRNLFRLNQAMGGVTLEEIVLQIRTLLMEEGKELVLLIEDFAALSGIQEVLLSVCIQEAVRDGKQVRSPMRTALAVTDGYMASRDTILTRAKREWIVESNLPNDEDVLSRVRQLVGAYLNAARWGEAELIKRFEQSRQDSVSSLTDWIETYRNESETDEEADLLKAFGKASDVPLFPYNKEAINKLSDDHLRSGGKLQFNPRKVINHVIRELLMQRNKFQNGSFPAENFSRHSSKASIANWVASKKLSPQAEGRLSQVIIYWGGNPDEPEQLASLNSGVLEAFGLPALGNTNFGPKSPVPTPPAPKPKPPEQTDPPIEPHQSPTPSPDQKFIKDWQKRLDDWVNGTELGQIPANQLRTSIVFALNNAVDWNALCMKPIPAKQSIIELPNARGNPIGERKLVYAQGTSDRDGRLRRTLLAFLRFEKNDARLDYPDADEDSVYIANAVERLATEYSSLILKEASEDISYLATALARQGRILGVAPKKISGRKSIVDAVFSPAPDIVKTNYNPEANEDRWFSLIDEATKYRNAFQEMLASKIGAFQGTGSTVYAIDMSRLSIVESEALKAVDGMTPDQREHLRNLSLNRLRARAFPLAENVSGVTTIIRNALGENFDKQLVCSELKQLAESAEKAAVWPANYSLNKRSFNKILDELRDAPISDILEKLEPLGQAVTNDALEDVLHFLGKTRTEEAKKVKKILIAIRLFLEALEKEVAAKELQDTGMTIPELIKENTETLRDTEEYLKKYKEW